MRYKKIIAFLVALVMMMPMQAFALGETENAADQAQNDGMTVEQMTDSGDDEAASEESAEAPSDAGEELTEETGAGDVSADLADESSAADESAEPENVPEEAVKDQAEAAGEDSVSGEWTADDFTFRDTDLTSLGWSVAPANDSGDKLEEEVCIVTGFSESGTAKLADNKDVVIPVKSTEGKTVQGIGASAFSKKGITSVKLPEGVMADNNGKWDESVTTRGDFFIGSSAFLGNELTELTIPEGVLYIGGNAFGSNKLTKVSFPSTVMIIANPAFYNNQITTLEFTKTTTFPLQIDAMAFMKNQITEVYLPAKTSKVTNRAFMQNTGMEPVTGGTSAEKQGGIVYMHVKDPGSYIEDTTKGNSYVQKLIVESGDDPSDPDDPGEPDDPDPSEDPSAETTWTAADFTFAEYTHSGEAGQRLYGCDYSRDFTITGIAVTGFSESGEKKLGKSTDIVIPSADTEGHTIMGVAPDAFYNKGLTSVQFPTGMLVNYDDTLSYRITKRGNFVIGESAFARNKLKNVYLPDGVIAVMGSAFAYNEIERVTLPKTIWWVETLAFAHNEISKVNFPETTYFSFEMHGWPFADNNIRSVRLPDMTKVVNKYVFQQNPGMVRLTDEQLRKAFNQSTYDSFTEEEKANIGMVYMYTDTVEDLDRIHHFDQQTESTRSYFQKLIINDGTPGTQYQDEDAWNLNDFTISGTKVTGLSESGIAKRKVNKDLVIPDYNAKGDPITEIASAPAAQTGGLFATADEKFDTLTLPSGLLKIGDNAFREAGLKDVAFPPDLEEIGVTAFSMNNLTSVILPDTVTKIGGGAFSSNKDIRTINLSSGLTEIPDGAFGCSDMNNWMTNLKEIEIPEGITRIGKNAFAGNNFSSIYIPDGVTEIGEYAFSTKNYLLNEQSGYCDVRLPESLTTLGNRAFRNKNIAVVHLPASVKKLESETFEKMLSTYGTPDIPGSEQYDLITRVYVSSKTQYNDKTNFPESTFHQLILTDYDEWTAEDFEYENGVIKGFSDLGADKIKKNGAMKIPSDDGKGNEFTEIAANAFKGCGVTSVEIPAGIGTIGESAFADNDITEVTFPASVTSIGKSAFENNSINELTFAASSASPLSIGDRGFARNELLAVQLPAGTQSVAGTAFIANKGIEKISDGSDEEISGGVVNMYITDPGEGVECISNGKSKVQELIADEAMPDSSSEWNAADFTHDETGQTITGLSVSGKIKFVGNRDLILPDQSPDGKRITGIGNDAFAVDMAYVDVGKYDYNTEEGIETVRLPQYLETIGDNAFIYNSLTNLDFSKAANLTSIGETAFKGNHLKSVQLTDKVTTVGSGAFSANNITSIRMPENDKFTVIPQAVFSMNIRLDSVKIPEQITEIGDMAFAGARLTSLTIPSSVRKVGRKAFHLHHLTTLTIPGSVKEIGESAFEGTYKAQTLTTLKLNEGIESIGRYAFKEGLLTSVDLPESLVTMDHEPFLNNTGDGDDHIVTLKTHNKNHLAFNKGAVSHVVEMVSVKVTFDAGVGKVSPASAMTGVNGQLESLPDPEIRSDYSFTGWYTAEEGGEKVTAQTVFEKASTIYARYIKTPWKESDFTFDGATVTGFSETGAEKIREYPDLILPASNNGTAVTSVGSGFARNKDIQSLVMPDSITEIAGGAFTQCTALTRVEFSSKLTAIPQAAFNTCDLESVVLPEGITSIGNNAFAGNLRVTEIKLPSTLTSIGNGAFGNSQITELVIPGSVRSIGNYAFRVNNENLSNTLKTLKLNEGLETIGNAAFGRSDLTEVTLPSTVTSIHKNAFLNSTRTVDVYTDNAELIVSDNPAGQLNMILPVRTVTFDANGGKTDAVTLRTDNKGKLPELPTASTDKELYVFEGWFTEREDGAGEQITADSVIPGSMTLYAHYRVEPWETADFTFDDTGAVITGFSEAGLAKFELSKNVELPSVNNGTDITEIGTAAFEEKDIESVKYPAKLTKIGERAFRSTNLKEAIIPDTVTELGNGAYAMTFSLEKIKLSAKMTAVPAGAFVRQLVKGNGKYDDYPAVSTVVIPEGVTSIGNSAFQGLNISTLTLPGTLTDMEQAAFSNNKIAELEIPGTLKKIPKLAFGKGKAMFSKPVGLEKLTLNEGLEEIGVDAFENSSLTEVQLPTTVRLIDDTAFRKGLDTTDPKDGWVLLIGTAEQRADPAINTGTGYGHRFQYVITYEITNGDYEFEDGKTDGYGKIIGGLPALDDPTVSFSGWFAEGSETAATDDDVYKADTVLKGTVTKADEAASEAAKKAEAAAKAAEEAEKTAEGLDEADDDTIAAVAAEADKVTEQADQALITAEQALEQAQEAQKALPGDASEEEKAQAAANVDVAGRAVSTAQIAKASAVSTKAAAGRAAAKASEAKAAEAKAAAEAAAAVPGQGAVTAAQDAEKAAQDAQSSAEEAAKAAEDAVAEAQKAVDTAATEADKATAEEMLKSAQAAAKEANDAAVNAKIAAADARVATAAAEREAAKAAQSSAEAERDAARAAQSNAESERDAANAALARAESAVATAEAQRDAVKYTPAKVKLRKVFKGRKKANVKWKTIRKNVKGYQIQVVNKKTGKVVRTVKVKQKKKLAKKKNIYKVVKKLKKGRYKIRVRAYNVVKGKTYYGKWSRTKTVRIR